MRAAKLLSHATAAAVLSATVFFASGCPAGKPDSQIKINSQQNDKAADKANPAKNAPPPPSDYFPLKVNFSWKYYLWNCPACPRTTVDVVISGVKQIGGKKVYLINKGNSGYFEEGDTVYLALINNGKLLNMGVAGKHNLKPGDAWEIELDSKGKVAIKDEGTAPGGKKKRSWKYELATQGPRRRSVCGKPRLTGFPSDEPTRQTYFDAICCSVVSDNNGEKKTEHSSCYAAGVGLVAEYFTDARSEIAGYSVTPQPASPDAGKNK